MKPSEPAKTLGTGAAAAFVVALVLLDAQDEWVESSLGDRAHVLLNDLQLLAGPLAVLLFAFGVQWASHRRFARALPALVALPTWSLVWLELATFTSRVFWGALVLAPLRGIQPFGAAPP